MERLFLEQDVRGPWRLQCNFTAIEDAILSYPKRSQPILVMGPYIYEEMQSYVRSRRSYAEYSGVFVDGTARHPFDMLRAQYWGRTALLRRVISFLNSYMIRSSSANNITELTDNIDANFSRILDQALADYISSRKNATRANEDFATVVSDVIALRFAGPFVLSASTGVTYLQAITLHKWSAIRKEPLVLLSDNPAPPIKTNLLMERRPISEEELIGFLEKSLPDKRNDVRKYFPLWRSTTPRRFRGDQHLSTLTLQESSSFVNFLKNVDFEVESGEELIKAIPSRIAAPVMFASVNGKVDLDLDTVRLISPAVVVGAARALKNQAYDVLSSGALQNSIPSALTVLTRMATVADRIEKAGLASESDIIEFGVEAAYLEHKIYEGREFLGDHSKSEIIPFLVQATAFLNRFEEWRNYRSESNSGAGLADASEVAGDLLTEAIAAGLMTDEASDRVSKTVLGDATSQPHRRAGATKSAENLIAVVGRGALRAAKAGGSDVTKEARKKVAQDAVNGSTDYILKNAPSLLGLAKSQTLRWVEMLVEFVTDVHN